MREITVYTIGSRRQRVAGDRLQITQAKMQGRFGFSPDDFVVPLNAVEFTVHNMPIFATFDEDTEEVHYFATEPDLWEKLNCAVRGELETVKRASARYEQRMRETLNLLDGFRMSPRWQRLLMAWRNEL